MPKEKRKTSVFSIKPRYRFCYHCNEEVSNSAYYVHKGKYFKNGVWLKKGELVTSSQEARCEDLNIVNQDSSGIMIIIIIVIIIIQTTYYSNLNISELPLLQLFFDDEIELNFYLIFFGFSYL